MGANPKIGVGTSASRACGPMRANGAIVRRPQSSTGKKTGAARLGEGCGARVARQDRKTSNASNGEVGPLDSGAALDLAVKALERVGAVRKPSPSLRHYRTARSLVALVPPATPPIGTRSGASAGAHSRPLYAIDLRPDWGVRGAPGGYRKEF